MIPTKLVVFCQKMFHRENSMLPSLVTYNLEFFHVKKFFPRPWISFELVLLNGREDCCHFFTTLI